MQFVVFDKRLSDFMFYKGSYLSFISSSKGRGIARLNGF